MKKRESDDFLAQFAASRKGFDSWPAWMRDSASVATAKFPRQEAGASKPDRITPASPTQKKK